ncbi:hypothetical protein AB0F07_11465 [Streptomyces fructofermentans]|uniref:hypothetical protein n=1 Tax=Streptomyces fructofermentans TaxID=152141 RepID=UPI0033EF46A8
MEQVVIVLPKRLGELLEDVDGVCAAHLALDFAEHSVAVLADTVDPPLRALCLDFTAAAREAVAGGAATERLLRARRDYLALAARIPRSPDALHVADAAVDLGCRRMLEDAGVLIRARKVYTTVQYVARRAQSDVGRRSAELAPPGTDRDGLARIDRAARWEEARWQLLRVVTTEPNPHGAGAGLPR